MGTACGPWFHTPVRKTRRTGTAGGSKAVYSGVSAMRIRVQLSAAKLHGDPTVFALLPLSPKQCKKPRFNLSNLLIAGRKEIRYNRYDL